MADDPSTRKTGRRTPSPGVVLTVKVVPGSSKTALAGTLNGMLKVKVAAPPEKGKANEALIDFLAETLGVKRNMLILVRGHTHSVKQVQISGAAGADGLRRLSEIMGHPYPDAGAGG